MGEISQISSLETVVAYFFAFTAVATLLLTSWAYIYQKRRESINEKESRPSNYGDFFIRR